MPEVMLCEMWLVVSFLLVMWTVAVTSNVKNLTHSSFPAFSHLILVEFELNFPQSCRILFVRLISVWYKETWEIHLFKHLAENIKYFLQVQEFVVQLQLILMFKSGLAPY